MDSFVSYRRPSCALLAGVALAACAVMAASQASAAANCIKGDRKAPYTVGWANI